MKSNTLFLIVISILLLGTLYVSYTNTQQVEALKQENANLHAKIDSVLEISREL